MRAIDFLVEYQKLDEVNMSPSSLKMLVKSINATAGMELAQRDNMMIVSCVLLGVVDV